MSLIFYKLLAAGIIFLASILVVIYPLQKKTRPSIPESAQLGEALASGIFFGAAFFHMLPDAITSFGEIYSNVTYPFPELICACGFLLLLFLERFSINRPILSAENLVPYVLLTMLTIHALTEGAALGIGATYSETIMLFIAIIAHKGTETFALCVTLMRHQVHLKKIIVIILFFALMTPVGILLGASIDVFANTHGALIAAIFNAFAAGTFLYISTLHHIHFHKHPQDVQAMAEFSCLLLGVSAMAAIAIWT